MDSKNIYRITQFSYKNEFRKIKSFFKKENAGTLGVIFTIFSIVLATAITFIILLSKNPALIIFYLLIGILLASIFYFFIVTPIKHWIQKKIGIYKSYPKLLEVCALGDNYNSILIPRLKLAGNFSLIFRNKVRGFKRASFTVKFLKGNTCRIGIKLLNNNGNSEIFVFHPYINSSEQEGLSYRITNNEEGNKIDNHEIVYSIDHTKPIEYILEYEGGRLRCFLGDKEVGTDRELKISNKDNLHYVKLHFWNHGVDSIEADLSKIEITWE